MPLTPEIQKTELDTIKTRLETKLEEASNLRSQLKAVINCAVDILEEEPQDRDLKTALSDTRLEKLLRAHVVTKGNMLAPTMNNKPQMILHARNLWFFQYMVC